MPFYEYKCGACGHRLEALQKISDEPLVYCPECNDPSLKKQISAAAFRLKGTGWYETDFKGGKKDKEDSKSSDKASTKKESSDKPASGASGDTPSKSTSSSSKDATSKTGSASSAST